MQSISDMHEDKGKSQIVMVKRMMYPQANGQVETFSLIIRKICQHLGVHAKFVSVKNSQANGKSEILRQGYPL